MSDYLVHASGERVRFRHPIFAVGRIKLEAMQMLKKAKGVAGIKPGFSSILILIEPEASLPLIRKELEAMFPALTASTMPASSGWRREPVIMKKRASPAKPDKRKLELKSLLASGVATAVLALTGRHNPHALAGGIFSLLAIHHVWERRQRM